MRYFTIGFYVVALLFNILKYGLIYSFEGDKVLDYLYAILNIALMIYWMIPMWKSDILDKKSKIGYSFGLIFITFILAPLIAFKLHRKVW